MKKDSSLECRVQLLENEVLQLKKLLQTSVENISPGTTDEEQIINVNEAIKLLDIPRHILYAKVTSGQIPGFRIGKLYKFNRQKLIEWQLAEKHGNHVDIEEYVNQYMQKNILKS